MTAGDSEPGGMGAPGDESQGPSRSKDCNTWLGLVWATNASSHARGAGEIAVPFLNLPHSSFMPVACP